MSRNRSYNILEVQKQFEDEMTKEIISRHTNKIWQGSNGRWYTYLEEDNKKRKLIAKGSKKELEEVLLHHYSDIIDVHEFGAVFEAWNDRRLELKQIEPGTHNRFVFDYKRFCTGISRRSITELKIEDYIELMEMNISKYDMDNKALSRLKSIIKGTVNYGHRIGYVDFLGKDIIDEFETLSIRLRKNVKEDYQEVFYDDEMVKLMSYLQEHMDELDAYKALYLIFLTGIRVGECVALKHCDISNNMIAIRRTESSYMEDHKKIHVVKDFPKTQAGFRNVILPSKYEWFLNYINSQHTDSEFLFYGERGDRLCVSTVEKELRKLCQMIGTYPKSPHKIRKTYCSILLDNKLDNNFIKNQIGHTDVWCTENYYHRNRKSVQEKQRIIDSIPEFV